MKIAHLVKPWLSIPPTGYGGIERIVYSLTLEQSKQNEIYLFAPGDSNVPANIEVISLYDYGQDGKGLDRNTEVAQVIHCIKNCEILKPDLIHAHSIDSFLGFSAYTELKKIFTFHCNPSPAAKVISGYASEDVIFSFLSNYHRQSFSWIKNATIIYPGINLNCFSFKKQKKQYLVYIGRITEQKGVLDAIEISNKSGMPLFVAGKARPEDKMYFEQVLKKIDQSSNVKFIGEISCTKRNDLLRNASALLFPINKGEPFGLIQIESMALGTPVIAYDIGAANEIVQNGTSGFLVNNINEAVEATIKLDKISPIDCRDWVSINFTSKKMNEKFLTLYSSE
jgi:glycosyltransferase involved in cell wall biosynthesis